MRRLKYPGDKTGTIRTGDILGPDAGGLYHEVTSVRLEDGSTIVETRHRAPSGKQRVRYFGGRNNPPPPDYDEEGT